MMKWTCAEIHMIKRLKSYSLISEKNLYTLVIARRLGRLNYMISDDVSKVAGIIDLKNSKASDKKAQKKRKKPLAQSPSLKSSLRVGTTKLKQMLFLELNNFS